MQMIRIIHILLWKYFDQKRFECFCVGKSFFESNKKHFLYSKNSENSAYHFANTWGWSEDAKNWFPKSIKKDRKEKLKKLDLYANEKER